MLRKNMSRFLGGCPRIAAVTIGATKVEGRRLFRVEVRIVGILMTLDAAGAFGLGDFLGLAQQVLRCNMLGLLSGYQEKLAEQQAPKKKQQEQDDEDQAGKPFGLAIRLFHP